MVDERYSIVKITNRKTNVLVCSQYYDIALALNKCVIERGLALRIVFFDGFGFTHETVEKVDAFGEYGLKITTTKKEWYIDIMTNKKMI